ncbi:Flp family type IVb pilin [Brenneria goodwinii]|uniref:Flp pilus assembly protein, pilin Flp n=2 Tax=Brenneria goodwinii TaxID=1109412 RepID=A0A0G4JQY2_9GAMM|nr:Flp family type IVb pilin [Brenneria goodwinii]MCG8159092.1 Flp family type IVb pilin [Brenneria goodwinii]MCG8162944.1 Flp family type IVb pilin [Brenneria goodwinii]MCG8167426.1 Flp family type IVb pilin [Brenneria goodwinii]MCG8172085.1 Flp family type IVb pilin [Brenneria goodwinii]MCG8176911.1 Flp family type IVb pilin [Brenneria goodwinii]
MNNMKKKLHSFLRDESGVTAIEYGILAAAMAAAIGAIFGSDGIFVQALNEKFREIADQITGSGTSGSGTTGTAK